MISLENPFILKFKYSDPLNSKGVNFDQHEVVKTGNLSLLQT